MASIEIVGDNLVVHIHGCHVCTGYKRASPADITGRQDVGEQAVVAFAKAIIYRSGHKTEFGKPSGKSVKIEVTACDKIPAVY